MTSPPAVQLGEGERNHIAKFELVALAELKTRLPAKLQALVEEYRDKLEKLSASQGGKLVLEKGTTRRISGRR